MIKKALKTTYLGLTSLLIISTPTILISNIHNSNNLTNNELNTFSTYYKSSDDLSNISSDEIINLKKYDSREQNIVTPVTGQRWNNCWAYAIASALETNILKQSLFNYSSPDELDINELNIDYATNQRYGFFDPLELTLQDRVNRTLGQGAYLHDANNALMQWNAPVKQTDPYGSINNPLALIKNIEFIPQVDAYNSSDPIATINRVKEIIYKYGSAAFWFVAKGLNNSTIYYNGVNDIPGTFSHACAIVGWDDTIKKESYSPASKYDGGWIVKNSFGPGSHQDGYFYMSYDSIIKELSAYELVEPDTYENEYYYDGNTIDIGGSFVQQFYNGKKLAAIFPSKKGSENQIEKLQAINLGIRGKNVTTNIKVYKDVVADLNDPKSSTNNPTNGELVAVIEKTFENEGYHTIDLEKQITLNSGKNFSVVVEVSNATNDASIMISKETSTNDMTYQYDNGSWISTTSNKDSTNWELGNFVPRIKAFTSTETISIPEPEKPSFPEVKPEKPNPPIVEPENPIVPPTPSPEEPTNPSPTPDGVGMESDIIINEQPKNSQEIFNNSSTGLDLTINASSKQGKDLTYQWYVNKSSNGLEQWQKINGATNSTYTIPSSELNKVINETTWQYKVDIKYKDDTISTLTLGNYNIIIKPHLLPTPPTSDYDQIKSDVVINKQPETTQETQANKSNGLDLVIDAKSTQGKQLKYQWYENKGDGWKSIDGATNSTYNIPSTELQAVKTETTWQYKAEIQYNDGTNAKLTSQTYNVKVKPTTNNNLNTSTIVGISVGTVAGATLLSGVLYFLKRRKNNIKS